jgi:hypothetical protein
MKRKEDSESKTKLLDFLEQKEISVNENSTPNKKKVITKLFQF